MLVVEQQKSWYCTNRPNIEMIMKIAEHVRRKDVPAPELEAYQKIIYTMLADAAAKGVKVTPPSDMFWGDRIYDAVDRDGHHWGFGSRKSTPTPAEMAAALRAMMGG